MQIVKVKYIIEGTGTLSSREYSYYSETLLNVGDIVNVPVRDTICEAQVSAVDVPDTEISAFKDKVKTIPAGSLVTPTLEQPALPITETAGNTNNLPASETALIKINPSGDSAFLTLREQAEGLLGYAESRIIASDSDLLPATDDLSIISRVKKAIKEKQDEYLNPPKEHIKSINAAFRTLIDPIEQADRLTRDKILGYRAEQEKKRQEAEEINRQKEELARKEAALNQGEVTINTTPVFVPEPTVAKVKTELGTAGTVRTRKARVVNFALLPDTYKLPNEKLLATAAKTGVQEIDGVEFYIEESLRVTTR